MRSQSPISYHLRQPPTSTLSRYPETFTPGRFKTPFLSYNCPLSYTPRVPAIHNPLILAPEHEPFIDAGMANTNEEPADAYGRHEGCFLDYKKAPIRFEDVLRNLEPIRLVPSRNSSGGLIPEPGLQVGTFPEPSVGLDEPFETTGHEYSFDFTKEIGDSLTPLVPRTSLLRDLQLPLELPDLRSNPIADLADYLKIVGEKRLGNPLAQWLPISPTIDEEDEGLHFPAKAARLHSLLLRELACESIEVPQEVTSSEQELKDPMPAKAPSTYEKPKSRVR